MSGRSGSSARPLRTCVGCRVRTDTSDLLRVVVVDGTVVPDPRGRLPGRGASLHPDQSCLALAERRRAFPRAFRHAGPLDLTALRDWVEEHSGRGDTSDQRHNQARQELSQHTVHQERGQHR